MSILAVDSTPDLIGEAGRVQIVAQMIADMQAQMFKLEMVQAGNGHGPNDIAPGTNPPRTYLERTVSLQEGIDRVCKLNEALMPAIAALAASLAPSSAD